MIASLIDHLVHAHRHATRLNADDWTHVVRTEADAYAVQEGVAAALGWPRTRWKSGGAAAQGPFSHSPVAPASGTALIGLEVEVALRVDAQGEPEAMCAAVECIASRWEQGLDAPALLRMADFQSNAGWWLGPWQPWQELDWGTRNWCLALAGQPEIRGCGGHALANPAAVLPAWRAHGASLGQPIQAGTVVTTGAWAGLHPVSGSAHGSLNIEGLGELRF
ncbi:hypothetical protein [Roseateles sp. BYS87W]|uniref:2-keto-4-pentenoate hydratase n=1 Tax=Pelomonas baiyunensis TaxID=3299026 RepID=A0ABW7GW34_9BURK